MKRSSSVPEMTLGPSSSSSSSPAASLSPGAASLKTRRGISSSQISLPGDLARPPPLSSNTMDTSSAWRAPPFSPIPLSRLNSPTSRPHRVEQLKKEECIDERQSEKEVMEINNLNQSYEELSVDTGDQMDVWPARCSPSHQPSFLSPSSPLAKLGNSARSRSLTPTSPLPNRTYCRRSCSPVLRPSQLWTGQKRKREDSYLDVDMDTSPTNCPPKRFQPTAPRSHSPTISPTLTPNTGNSPLHHSSRKSSSQSESTPLSSPSSLHPPTSLSANPFAVNYDSGHSDHWLSSGSASSSGGQSPLLVSCGGGGRENGRHSDDIRRATLFPQAVEMKNNLHIETTGLPDPNPDVPSPLSPKGLQFRYRPFLPSSSLQSPIPRLANSIISGATPSTSRTPRPLSSSLLAHDKYLSPFNSDLLGPHLHGHAHTHPHLTSHRQLSKLRAQSHFSASSLSVPLPRPQTKPETETPPKSLPNRLSVHSPLSKLSVSTTVDEPVVGGRGEPRKKRRNSEISIDVMESDSSLAESCDEGIDMATGAKQT